MPGYHQYQSCIEACLRCAALCNHCASSCLQEEHLHMMARCVQLDMECAAICYASAQLMSLGSDRAAAICRICADACEACAAECSKHVVKNALRPAVSVQKNVARWLFNNVSLFTLIIIHHIDGRFLVTP
jgi:hypothetical protein